jgi:hypothetical protein
MLARLLVALVVLLAAASGFAASPPEPIVNLENLPVKTQGDTPSASQVRAAIIAAGRKRNWTMIDGQPGELLGSIVVRGKHKAEVKIAYSPQSYSIVYRDSDNLSYDGRNIHSAYNRWVKDLAFNIAYSLAAVDDKRSTAMPTSAPAVAASPAPAAASTGSTELGFWESVRDSRNPAELQAYLDQYPNGAFASLAKVRLATLRKGSP